jgi:aminomethyltransferase
MGYCLYGNEINDTTSPISAGLKWVTQTKTKFLNYTQHKKSIENGIDKKLIGFEMETRGIPRSDYLIFDKKEKPIGNVTSGTQSPSLNKGIGIGYVKSDFSKIGKTLYIKIRDKFVPCTIVSFPFYKNKI